MDTNSLVLVSFIGIFALCVWLYRRYRVVLEREPVIRLIHKQLSLEKHSKTVRRQRDYTLKMLARLEASPFKRPIRYGKNRPKRSLLLLMFIAFHIWLHFSSPYATTSFVDQPYTTRIENDSVVYKQHYETWVWSNPLADLLGYYKQGFLIVENTLLGGKRINATNANAVIDEIHSIRFDPSKPYLISGDQFSVLYPRNLGVFYNQLLDPNTAHSQLDWENRQRIYLQSALFATDGLADSDVPKTTLIPIGPRTIVTTQVHPGDVGSDSVYGLLFSLDAMRSDRTSRSGEYHVQTRKSVERILREKQKKLEHIVTSYVDTVRDERTGMVREDIKLSAARDGVTRKSSFYDNVVLWNTLSLAESLDIYHTPKQNLDKLQQNIKQQYWNDNQGYYMNDKYDDRFSSDWLIGYVTGFFNLSDSVDLERSERTVAYINQHNIADPFPIKYQEGDAVDMPFIISTFVPMYGSEAIWSYWGAQYITLLADLRQVTNKEPYYKQAEEYVRKYDAAIVRDGGFAETYSPDGTFLRHGLYKSIRITGWVVQYEHAKFQLKTISQH